MLSYILCIILNRNGPMEIRIVGIHHVSGKNYLKRFLLTLEHHSYSA